MIDDFGDQGYHWTQILLDRSCRIPPHSPVWQCRYAFNWSGARDWCSWTMNAGETFWNQKNQFENEMKRLDSLRSSSQSRKLTLGGWSDGLPSHWQMRWLPRNSFVVLKFSARCGSLHRTCCWRVRWQDYRVIETEIKYEGYISKAMDQVAKMKRMERKINLWNNKLGWYWLYHDWLVEVQTSIILLTRPSASGEASRYFHSYGL